MVKDMEKRVRIYVSILSQLFPPKTAMGLPVLLEFERVSILSQLLLEQRLQELVNRFVERFQFFPSCFREEWIIEVTVYLP